MKITDKRNSSYVNFGDVEIGSVFAIDTLIYMKTHLDCSALNLRNGRITTFSKEYRVTPVDCELIIK